TVLHECGHACLHGRALFTPPPNKERNFLKWHHTDPHTHQSDQTARQRTDGSENSIAFTSTHHINELSIGILFECRNYTVQYKLNARILNRTVRTLQTTNTADGE